MGRPQIKAALENVQRGFSVFRVRHNEKRPRFTNWQQEATQDPKKIERWFSDPEEYNIGGVTTDRLVVDLDTKRDGLTHWKDFVELHAMLDETLPPTLVHKTASGGRHLIYDMPWDFEKNQPRQVSGDANVLGPGIDIRGKGQLIVLPGSKVPQASDSNAGRYAVLDERPIAEAPEWLIALCNAPRKKAKNAGVRVAEETPEAVERGWKIMEKWPAGDAEYAGDHAAFAHAAELGDLGLDTDTAVEILHTWNERLDDPMDPERIEEKVKNAYIHRQTAIGGRAPTLVEFEAVPIEEIGEASSIVAPQEPPADAFKPQWLDALNPAEIEPRDWIIEGLAVRGKVSVIVGPGAVGKSAWENQAAVAVATGRSDISGFKVPKRGRVWVWNQEDDKTELDRRFAAVLQHFEIPLAELRDGDRTMLAYNSGVEAPWIVAEGADSKRVLVNYKRVREMIETIRQESIDLLILDPLVELHRVNEVENGPMAIVWGAIRDIAVKGNCAVLVIAHARKLDRADSEAHIGNIETLRGASSQGNVIRKGETMFTPPKKDETRWKFEYPREEYVRMDDAKNNLGPKRLTPVWFHRVGVRIKNGERVGVLQPTRIEARIKVTSEGQGLKAIARALSQLPPGLGHTLNDLEAYMTADERAIFEDKNNLSRTLDALFDERDKAPVDGGMVLRAPAKRGTPPKFQLVPHIPQTGDEEADKPLKRHDNPAASSLPQTLN